MSRAVFALAALLVLPMPAQAELQMITARYLCERGVEVPVAYVNADGEAVVTLTVEGSQISLYQERSASGARYGWPSDGSNYVWWSKGDTAVLYWKDATGAETPILSECKQQL